MAPVRVRAELEGAELEGTYGCPDCADGGAMTVVLVRGGSVTEHSHEYFNPPEPFERLDPFVKALTQALRDCESNELIALDVCG
jgi:hypothetical protein